MIVFVQPLYITTRAAINKMSIAPLLDYPVRDLAYCKHKHEAKYNKDKSPIIQEKNYIKSAYLGKHLFA